jgi:hypothetical protein
MKYRVIIFAHYGELAIWEATVDTQAKVRDILEPLLGGLLFSGCSIEIQMRS